MRLANYTRDVTTGDALLTGSTQIFAPDGSPIATVAVNAVTGRWAYEQNGSPGITKAVYTGAGQTRAIQGDAYAQNNYAFEGELPEMMSIHGSGVYSLGGLALSAPGGMNARVGVGYMFILGVLLPIYTAQDLAVVAAHATLARIDNIVGRLTRTGTFAGKTELAIVTGIPAGSPVAPVLAQDVNTWEAKVGQVAVAAAASSIVAGNLSTTGRHRIAPQRFVGETTWDPPGIASSERTSVTVAVPGAQVGDPCSVSLSTQTSSVFLSAFISSADIATVTLFHGNPGGSNINLGSGTLKVVADRA
jgi:hypothetical protein